MAEIILTCVGEACPVPLIKAQKKLEEMKAGEVLIIKTDQSCAVRNIPEWAGKRGYIVNVEEVDHGLWEVYIEKHNLNMHGGLTHGYKK